MMLGQAGRQTLIANRGDAAHSFTSGVIDLIQMDETTIIHWRDVPLTPRRYAGRVESLVTLRRYSPHQNAPGSPEPVGQARRRHLLRTAGREDSLPTRCVLFTFDGRS